VSELCYLYCETCGNKTGHRPRPHTISESDTVTLELMRKAEALFECCVCGKEQLVLRDAGTPVYLMYVDDRDAIPGVERPRLETRA